MEEYDDSEPVNEELLPCKICGRSFYSRVLKKHIPICQKSAAKRRKVFDSSRQRAEGTDISTVKPLKPKLHGSSSTSDKDPHRTNTEQPEPPKKASSWRRKHEEFISTIRAAKGLTQVMKDGGPLPPPPPPSYDPDYIQCPCCQRRFSENAADRHIKFCKEQAARISNKSKFPGSDKAKTPARTQVSTIEAARREAAQTKFRRDQYKPSAVKKANPVSSASPVSSATSSRLPQRPSYGQGGGTGIPSKGSAGAARNMTTGLSSRANSTGLTSPPSGVTSKPRGVVAPSSLKNTAYGANKKKMYNADNYNSRNETKNENEVDYSTQGTKFCHECGTKYPVEWAKFCCECGVRRMCI